LKKELHQLIDSIDDEETLNVLLDDIVSFVIEQDSETDIMEELTPEQQKELDAAIKEADEGKVISFEEFKNMMAQWRTS
jgi:predicted RNA-binding protein YlqC (UPF0109 family)